MKLKTLNDFMPDSIYSDNDIGIRKSKLRAEAINHAKKLRGYNKEFSQSIGLRIPAEVDGAIHFIKHFFDLTEEDLK